MRGKVRPACTLEGKKNVNMSLWSRTPFLSGGSESDDSTPFFNPPHQQHVISDGAVFLGRCSKTAEKTKA